MIERGDEGQLYKLGRWMDLEDSWEASATSGMDVVTAASSSCCHLNSEWLYRLAQK